LYDEKHNGKQSSEYVWSSTPDSDQESEHCLDDDDEFSYESDIDGDETEDSDESDEEKSESNVK
jgi:hypothetical protein